MSHYQQTSYYPPQGYVSAPPQKQPAEPRREEYYNAHYTHTYPPHTSPPASSLDSSSYAGSAEDDVADVDMVDLLTQRFQGAFNSLTLDRALVVQAQTSGVLNAQTRELIDLQEEAARKMEETRRAFVEGMRCAKEVRGELEKVHRKVRGLKKRAEGRYPVEYNLAKERRGGSPSRWQ